jgi:tetratricopeptide (TPR) repeat protein/sugar lactone lactonase YvrE
VVTEAALLRKESSSRPKQKWTPLVRRNPDEVYMTPRTSNTTDSDTTKKPNLFVRIANNWESNLFLIIFMGLALFFFFFLNPNLSGYREPNALAIDSQGNLYVADGDRATIQKFDSDGNLILSWGKEGAGPGEFGKSFSVSGLVTDAQNQVYVLDAQHNRIEVFSNTGQFLNSWNVELNSQSFFAGGRMVIDSLGNLYITRGFAPYVQKLDKSGHILLSWGEDGQADGQFSSASSIAVDKQNRVYVVDNRRIQKFDNQGNFLAKWEVPQGDNSTKDNRIWSLCVDNQYNIYVGDVYAIQKFDNNGKLLAKWGGHGKAAGYFGDAPRDLATDSHNNIYAIDGPELTISRIQKFNNQGHFLAQWTQGIPQWVALSYNLLGLPFSTIVGIIAINYRLRKRNRHKTIPTNQNLTTLVINNSTLNHLLTRDSDNLTQPAFTKSITLLSVLAAVGVIILPVCAGIIYYTFFMQDTNTPISPWIMIPILLVIAILVIWCIQIAASIRQLRKSKLESGETNQVLQEAIAGTAGSGETNIASQQNSSSIEDIKGSGWLIVGLVSIAGLSLWIILGWSGGITNLMRLVWPSVPDLVVATVILSLILLLVMGALALIVIVGQLRQDSTALQWQDWGGFGQRLFKLYGLPILAVLLITTILALFFSSIISSDFFGIVIYLIIGCGILFFGFTSLSNPDRGFFWVFLAIKQGNYDSALRRISFLYQLTPNISTWLWLHATTLQMSGRLVEAEQLLARHIDLIQTSFSQFQSNYLNLLGEILMFQGRYDEALIVLEKESKLRRNGHDVYNNIATLYLRQGLNPQRALELVTKAIENKEAAIKKDKSEVKKFGDIIDWGEILGNQAWALAQLGQYEQAEQVLDQAFTLVSPTYTFGLAALYYRTGEVSWVYQDYAGATQNFQLAIESDPQGVYRLWAETALKELEQLNRNKI